MTTIAINGYAQVGKDTFFTLLKEMLPHKTVTRIAFADALKEEVNDVATAFGYDVFNLSKEQKAQIRALLVWWGCERRRKDPDYWVNLVKERLESSPPSDVRVITDNRFLNETLWVKSLPNPIILSIKRYNMVPNIGKSPNLVWFDPANDEEKENQPKISQYSDFSIEWPSVEKSINELKIYVDFFIKTFGLNK